MAAVPSTFGCSRSTTLPGCIKRLTCIAALFATCMRLVAGRGDVMQSVVAVTSRKGFAKTLQKVQASGDKLVFDVGLNNAKDAQFYIENGFTVIGVEANPLLVEAVNEHSKDLIRKGKLVVIHGGIEETVSEPLTFYRNVQNNVMSSFEAAKCGNNCEPVQVPMLRCEALWVFGRPYYLKVDIEERHYTCVNTLKSLPLHLLPQYVSWEMHEFAHQKPYPVVDTELILTLFELGYTTMKIVKQGEGDVTNGLPETSLHYHSGQAGWANVHEVIQAGVINPRPAWVDFVMRLNVTQEDQAMT